MKRNRCVKCGKVCSKYSRLCHKCHKEHMEAIHAESQLIVDKGVCPECGGKLVRNLALPGWYQCEFFGSGDSCSFQLFTE